MVTLPSRKELSDYISLTPLERKEFNRDIRCFLLFFSYYFSEAVKYPFAKFHQDFANDLVDLTEGKITSLVWCTARETAKSAFASAWLLWLIANGKDDYFNVDSFDSANSEGFLFDVVLTLQTNHKFIADYGQLFNSSSTTNEKTKRRTTDFITPTNVRVEAHTTQEPVRGRRHDVHIRPSVVILDDFEVLQTVHSESLTRNIAAHISEFQTGLDQHKARLLFLCNWLSDTGNVASLKASSALDPKTRFREVWRIDKETGQPTWMERDVLTDLELNLPENEGKVSIEAKRLSMRKADTGDADWEREMMGNPVDPLGDGPDSAGFMALFPKDTIRITDNPFYENPPYSLGVDPAGEGHDETLLVLRSAFHAKMFAKESKSTPKSIALLVVKAIREYSIKDESVVIDSFGIGYKCVQELAGMGHRVKAINSGEKEEVKRAWQEALYNNDRALGYFRLKEWMAGGGELCSGVDWSGQLKCIRFRTDEKGKRQIIPKKEIIKRGYKSPDMADALSYSFLTELSSNKTRVVPSDPEPISKYL